MQFTSTLLSLVALGVNILPAMAVAVPNGDMARRADDATNHLPYVNSDKVDKRNCGSATLAKRHEYCSDLDELVKRNCGSAGAIGKRHEYCSDADELSKRTCGAAALAKRHEYCSDADELE
jgi:hypothetical protein